MALTTGGFSTYAAKGNREDLSDIIANISPTDRPFMSAIGKAKATAVYHEWQTDSLAATTTAATLEGDDITPATSSPTVRIGNYCQIFTNSWAVTETQDAVNKAGRASETAYQKAKRGRELLNNVEATLLANQGQTAGATNSARTLRGLPSWIATNVSIATDGANATAATAGRTDGTQRAFAETLLKEVIRETYDSGGDPSIVMVGSFNKQQLSGFTGRTSARQNVTANTILAAASIYASDFGDLKVVPNRKMRARDAFVLDPEMAAVATLRPVTSHDLAKTGDSDRGYLVTELTLVVKNEAAHGGVFDLTTS